MAITTTCPGCKAIFRFADELAGKSVRCQKCERVLVVPLPTVGVGASMPVPSEAEVERPVELIVEQTPPAIDLLAEPDIVESDAVLIEPVTEVPLSEVAPVATRPSVNATPSPPVQVDRPAYRYWTLAALASFLLAICATGVIAAVWVTTHLSPSPRVVLVPALKEANFNPVPLRDQQVFFGGKRKDPFKGGKIDGALPPSWLFFDQDQSVQKTDRLIRPDPNRDNGQFGNNGPFRTYQIRLERDKTYHFFVRARGFLPQLKIFFANLPFALGEVSADNRLFVTFTPKMHGEFTIWITSFPHQDGDFDLQVALERETAPKVVDLKNQVSVTYQETLRVRDRRDPAFPNYGPYHEYRVHLDASEEYVFKLNEPNIDAAYQPILQIFDNAWIDHEAGPFTRRLTHSFRAGETRPYRIRVTSKNYGEGAYTLHIERKVAPKPVAATKQLVRYLVQLDGQGQYNETHQMTKRDPVDPSAPGRGPCREYIVTMIKGQEYRVEVSSKRFPPMVSVFDSQNNELAHRKGAASVSLDFTPNQTGVYRIRAIATHPFDLGPYAIKIAQSP